MRKEHVFLWPWTMVKNNGGKLCNSIINIKLYKYLYLLNYININI